MDPLIDEGIMLFLEPVTDFNDLIIGDVICYKSGENHILHRIFLISNDDAGWFCNCMGDNNQALKDPERIRPQQIEYVYRGQIS